MRETKLVRIVHACRKKETEKNCLRLLTVLYVLAFLFLFVVVAATVYGLSYPELGLVETNPLVRAYMAEYGLVIALLIAIFVNSSALIFSGLFLTLYRMFQRRFNSQNPLLDSIAYSPVVTFGLYALITWLLNAANEVYVLLFHSYHSVIRTMWGFWGNMTLYVMVAMFLVLFLFLYMGRAFGECMHESNRKLV